MIKKVLHAIATAFVNFRYRKNIHGDGRIKCGFTDHVAVEKSAKLNLQGKMTLDANSNYGNGRSSLLRMDANSHINMQGNVKFMYGADIVLFNGALLELGDKSFINSNCKIRCHNRISIGNDCAISHDFTVMDSDAHTLNGDRSSAPITIGNHVWIGTRVTILKGVHVGDGVVIAAGSLVTHDIPAGVLAGGVPAKILKENVTWEK